MGPRADFCCLSKKCRQDDGSAAMYELPVAAVRCPVCSSKRIQRLFNAVNVASGIAKATDRMLEPAYTEAAARMPQAASGVRAIPTYLGKVPQTLQELGAGQSVIPMGTGSARPTPTAPISLQPIAGRPPRPVLAATLKPGAREPLTIAVTKAPDGSFVNAEMARA